MTVLFLVALCCIPVWFAAAALAVLTMDTGPDWLTGCAMLASRAALMVGVGAAVLFALAYGASLLPWQIQIGSR